MTFAEHPHDFCSGENVRETSRAVESMYDMNDPHVTLKVHRHFIDSVAYL